MFHPVTAELAVQEHTNRVKHAEQKAAQMVALASAAAPPAPRSRAFVVRNVVGSLVIRVGVWIQGSTIRNAPVAG